MKFRLSGSGGRLVPSRPQAAALARATLLAGGELETTYELTQGTPTERAFYELALDGEMDEFGGAHWPFEGELGDEGEVVVRDGESAVLLLDGTLVHVRIGGGWLGLRVAAHDRERAGAVVAAFAERYPATYRQETEENVVPITFWTYGQYGPSSRLRMIEAATWAEIEGNYSADVRAELAGLMGEGFEPGRSGQLILWQGPPGTGKTWALRALASEWRSWAEFNYITDPDAFFVTRPDYLIDVLLHDSYEELAVVEEEGEPQVVSTDRLGKWRVLILEDTGELLAENAKESYGQGLSRLLNVVDGLVGQGLRILVLVTTNDELGELHPAVKRPGRCASQVEFGPLSAEDASAWLGEEVEEGGTLAELYARRGDAQDAISAAAALAEVDVAALARVAEEHAPDGGYGETAWNAGERTVFWISADWSSNEEVDAAVAAFMGVSGVEHVEHEAEAALPEGDGWEVVWTSSAASAEDREETAAERWDRLAREVEEDEPEAVVAAGQASSGMLLRFAANELDAAHRRELEAAASRRQEQGVLSQALDALRALASRPNGDTHLTLPTEIRPHVTVHEPAITVEPSPAPNVTVEPPQVTVEAPQVTVEAAPAPEVRIEAPPAPDVHVSPEVSVTIEQPPRPASIRATKDEHGVTTFEVVEDSEL